MPNLCKTAVLLAASAAFSQEFHPPAETRYAQIAAAGSILPGGRVVQPFGVQIETGPGAFGIVLSPKGALATTDTGPERYGVTRIERVKNEWSVGHWWARTPGSRAAELADPDWKGVSTGAAFESEHSVWISEGDSGKLRLLDTRSGNHEKIIDLNQGEWKHSFTGDLAFDPIKRLLFVLDRANFRMVVVDSKKGAVLASVGTDGAPVAIALSPDSGTVFLTDRSVCVIDVRNPVKPQVIKRVTTHGAPGDILAAGDRVSVSHPQDDFVATLAAPDWNVEAEIPLRIPGLESLRGIEPGGMAFDPLTKWLLVAEAGINAVGVIDTDKHRLIGHIPVGWQPARVAIAGDRAYVTNRLGRGTGPNLHRPLLEFGEAPLLHRGSVSTFVLPAAGELPKLTGTVFAANGLLPDTRPNRVVPAVPEAIRHVVLIVKEGRSFDEVLGDFGGQNRRVQGVPQLARFGMHGLADGRRRQFSIKDAAVTPNHHGIAAQWAFSDNFYADSRVTETLLKDLESRGVSTFGQDAAPETASDPERGDQERADRFIATLESRYGKSKTPLPRFLSIRLPNDRLGEEREESGYPYQASYMADNDLALGRLVQYLSHRPEWRETAIFVTEARVEGLDHVDAHRTLLLAAGPWIRRKSVSHTNSDFAGLRRTIFELLRVPPMNLADATAASLRELFASEPDDAAWDALTPDRRIFDPAALPSRRAP